MTKTTINPYEPPRQNSAASRPAKSSFDPVLFEIRREAGSAILAGVLGIFIWIIAPLAIVNGRKTLQMIKVHNCGFEFEKRARLAIRLGFVGISLFLLAMILVFGGGGIIIYLFSIAPD